MPTSSSDPRALWWSPSFTIIVITDCRCYFTFRPRNDLLCVGCDVKLYSLLFYIPLLSTVGDRALPVAAAGVRNYPLRHITSAPALQVFCSHLKTHFNLLRTPPRYLERGSNVFGERSSQKLAPETPWCFLIEVRQKEGTAVGDVS